MLNLQKTTLSWMTSLAAATVVQASVQLASAVLYLWVSGIVFKRPVEGEAKRANALFGVWWLALGLVFLLAPLLTVPPRILGYEDLALAVSILNLLIVLIVVAVWGLVYYLVYLYTGNAKWFAPITTFYVLLAFLLLYWIALLNPTGFDAEGRLAYARGDLSGAPALGLLFSVPVVIAALAYGSLFFRVKGTVAKYRIGMVAGGFILQFGWSVVSTALGLSRRYPDSLWLALVSNALGVVAAVAVLLAFRPIRAVRTRLGITDTGGA